MHVLGLNCNKLLPYKFTRIKCVLHLLNRSISNETLKSIEKHLSVPLNKRPTTKIYEPFWYNVWEESKFFTVDQNAIKPNDEKFSMILPPPNLTGDLHMGHALTIAIEDAIYRFKKLNNPNCHAIFLPGYDHAGIGMFSVLDKLCQRKFGKRIYDLNKDEFDDFANKWKEERIRSIREQFKLMGASLDFKNEKFTLSEEMSKSVEEAFIKLHEQNLIYRDKGMVNWSYHLNSTISDIEVNWLTLDKGRYYDFAGNKMKFGTMYYIAFKLENSDDEIIVATTRPYTIPGDVAVAANPRDERFTHLIGRNAINPFTNKLMPIIKDDKVSIDRGSGLVKITPACSYFDFEMAQKHGLEIIEIFDSKGNLDVDCLRDEFSHLNGLNRFKLNEEVIGLLNDMELLKKEVNYSSRVPVCSRSGDLIEYRILPQWYLNVSKANEFIKKKLNNDELKLIPPNHKNTLLDWIKYEKPWCISRQINWGHRIPMYKFTLTNDREEWIAAHSLDEAKEKFNQKFKDSNFSNVEQDKDVMDTWFSSSLLPFSYLGWPNDNEQLKNFYPLSLMETGYDILKFWVHKMLISGYYLTGQLPFRSVLLHGMIVDSNGKKMSKSLGNVIDPSDFINGKTLKQLNNKLFQSYDDGQLNKEQLDTALNVQRKLYPSGLPTNSADGLRLFLYEFSWTYELFQLDEKNITKNRNLINKIWQSFNFLLFIKTKLENEQSIQFSKAPKFEYVHLKQLEEIDRWILSCLNNFVKKSKINYENHHFHMVYNNFIEFFLHTFCDIYMEIIKPSMYIETDERIKLLRFSLLKFCLSNIFSTMHPLLPFITEELYQKLRYLDCEIYDEKYEYKSLLQSSYPDQNYLKQFANSDLEDRMSNLMKCVVKVRWFNSIAQINKYDKNKYNFIIQSTDDVFLDFLENRINDLKLLAQNQNIAIDFNPPFILDVGCDTEYIVDKKVMLRAKNDVQIVVETSGLDERFKINLTDLLENRKNETLY